MNEKKKNVGPPLEQRSRNHQMQWWDPELRGGNIYIYTCKRHFGDSCRNLNISHMRDNILSKDEIP